MGFLTSPRIALGPGALEQLTALDLHRVALIVDTALTESPRLGRIRDELAKTDARVDTLPPVAAEPTDRSVNELGDLLRATSPDWIIAVGGGSTIDAAKGAWVRYAQPALALSEISPLSELGLRSKARLAVFPTTAGSGSEVTGLLHLHRADGGPILELASRELEPEWALLDPYWLGSLPPRQLALGGFDALAHALEALASDWSNPFTDALAREAVGLLVRELPKAVRAPDSLERLEALQTGATMAGLALSNAQAGVVHALAHALGALFEVPHAAAVAALLPYGLEYNFAAARERYLSLQGAIGPGPVQSRHALGARFRALAEEVGAPRSLADAGLAATKVRERKAELIAYALGSPSLVGNPRMPSGEELASLLEAAATGGALDLPVPGAGSSTLREPSFERR